MNRNKQSRWFPCCNRLSLFVAMQTMALGCYMGILCAGSDSSFEPDVWYNASALAGDWYHFGQGDFQMTPCRFAITDANDTKIFVLGAVEKHGEKKCLALVAASQSFRVNDPQPLTLRKYITRHSEDLEIDPTIHSFDGFQLYTILSPDFEILANNSQSQLPEERFPELSNSDLPEPTATNNVFPDRSTPLLLQNFIHAKYEYNAMRNESNQVTPSNSSNPAHPANPTNYFNCLNNITKCPDETFSSAYCPAGTYAENNTDNIWNCHACESGTYQGESKRITICQNVTLCNHPFEERYHTTKQYDNVCDCIGSKRFILRKYDEVDYWLTYFPRPPEPDSGSDCIYYESGCIFKGHYTKKPYPATYLFSGSDESQPQPYESLCIATAGYCNGSHSQQYGLNFQSGNQSSSCYVFSFGDNGNVSITVLSVDLQSTVSATSSININSQIPAIQTIPVSRTTEVMPEQPGQSVLSLIFFTSSVVLSSTLSPTLYPAIPANQNEDGMLEDLYRTPMGVGVLAGVVGTVLLVTIAVSAGLVTYYIYNRHRSDSHLAKATGSALMVSAAAALQPPQDKMSNAGACKSFDNVKYSSENPLYQQPPLKTEKPLNTEYPLNPTYETTGRDTLHEPIKHDSLYESIRHDSLSKPSHYETIRHDSLYESIRHDSLSKPSHYETIRHDSLSESNHYETIRHDSLSEPNYYGTIK